MILEEAWRRNEANMRRKQINVGLANSTLTSDSPVSPASVGAMDSLLEKLRAAAPQTRDTRDRRRRARLKDRHQVRVASGQQVPDTGDNESDSSLLSPTMPPAPEDGSATPSAEDGVSEGEDIADRAASLLQGLRGDGESETPGRDDSLRVRRRRESADDERAKRRAQRRTAQASTTTGGTEPAPTTIAEETEARDSDAAPHDEGSGGENNSSRSSQGSQLPTPTTVVVPPSPTSSEKAGISPVEAE